MAITRDNSATSTATSYSFTTSGSNRLLLVFTLTDGEQASAVTYGGVAMTKAQDVSMTGYRLQVWYLIAPASGSNTVAITGFSGGNDGSFAVSYTDVDQTSPVDVVDGTSNVGSGTTNKNFTTTTNQAQSLIVSLYNQDAAATLTPSSTTSSVGLGLGLFGATQSIFETGPVSPASSATITVSSNQTSLTGLVLIGLKRFRHSFSIAETVTATEATSAVRGALFSVLDTTTLSEVVSAIRGATFSILDAITASDFFSALFRWTRTSRETTNFTNESKGSLLWTNSTKNSSTFTNEPKN